jgi:hypothetical protein
MTQNVDTNMDKKERENKNTITACGASILNRSHSRLYFAHRFCAVCWADFDEHDADAAHDEEEEEEGIDLVEDGFDADVADEQELGGLMKQILPLKQ